MARMGPKRVKTKQELMASDTYQPNRHDARIEVVVPSALPSPPDWLTPEGHQVWLDNIGRVAQTFGATEVDTELFANYCNVQGKIISCWREDVCPRIQLLVEARKLQESLRIAGPSSRIIKVPDARARQSTSGLVIEGNPFSVNGRHNA